MSGGSRAQAIERLFDEALELGPAERSKFLDERCAADPEMRAEIERLLQHDSSARERESFLEAPVTPVPAPADLQPGQLLAGRYTLRRILGRGGMGVVWLAEQENPRREVAVKLIRPDFASPQLLRRFELEAAVLGRLRHPGIAQIYEAGMFDDGYGGRPFFAMEYVDGPPLLDFINQRKPGARERLELFTLICDAVHHAHQKGVVHRDLKPGNILVIDESRSTIAPASNRQSSIVKILDFGVARAIDSDLQVTTIQTGAGQLIGTLQYMSPEQVEGNADSIDTRSDVYGLGVILYQLLTGRLPYDLANCTIATAARVISDDEPAPLASIDRSLRGDIETILRKSLEKDPDRRYQSAAELAADITRHLNDEPIVARRATTAYQLRKFARRNKALVIGVMIAFAAVSAGAVAATIGMVRAERQAARAGSMNAFLQDVLIAADSARSGDMRLVDLLKDAGARVDVEFAGHADPRRRNSRVAHARVLQRLSV